MDRCQLNSEVSDCDKYIIHPTIFKNLNEDKILFVASTTGYIIGDRYPYYNFEWDD
jgi:hypothetical protein